MNISNEAVGAAESAVMTAMLERPGADGYVDGYREYARLALEAAAPHLMAHISTLDELVTLEPGTVIQGPDYHEETYKCTAPGTFHAIASPTEYRPSELVGRGPFTIIHKGGNS